MPSIDNFRAHLNRYSDVARSDRFKVFIMPKFKNAISGTGNSVVANPFGYNNVTEKLSFQCESAELPGRTLATFEARSYGPAIKYPYQTTYSDLNLTFICTGNIAGEKSGKEGIWEKRFFDKWMDLINPSVNLNPDSPQQPLYNIEYKDNYSSVIEVTHYDIVDDNPTYTAKFIEAFPISVNQMSLAWAEESVLRLTVTFAYSKWEIKGDSPTNKLEGSFQATASNDPKIFKPNLVDSILTSGKSIASGAISRVTNLF